MPKSHCPNGQQCLLYSSAINAGPEMDGCFGPCQRPQPRTVVTQANAKEEIERRMSDLVDLLALFIDIKVNPRFWSTLLIYAPKPPPGTE